MLDLNHLGWTIRTWRRVHWCDESRFLLRPTDGRARVWRQRNTSFQDNHILGTTAFGGGGVTVWGCFSFDCKLDLYVLDGNLTGQNYRDNVLAPRVVPHFDNHALADRPMFMDDNARPHRARKNKHTDTSFKINWQIASILYTNMLNDCFKQLKQIQYTYII